MGQAQDAVGHEWDQDQPEGPAPVADETGGQQADERGLHPSTVSTHRRSPANFALSSTSGREYS